ncbi:MAG: ABC transporter substrate-binding protein [Eubacteriales bacterium]|nr:ABC transporter substrate-binding protein [Eubacteriales bacterium]MDD4121601.1 ABC transporter substrate-binding protein [Eubacteriales bacterium]MDD4629661.1 ABC transporter substrate-binding protein [Eubacteriales bacterium]
MVKKNKRSIEGIGLIIFAFAMIIFLSGCENGVDRNTIYIAAAGPESRMEGEFKNGIKMAEEEIEQTGYLDGKSIQVDYYDDKRDLTTGIKIAQNIAEQKYKYSAVIGHWNASINIPAAPIYNNAGLLAMTPMVSSPDLTIPAKEYIFRMVPTDSDEARKMAVYAAEKNLWNIAICYTDSDYGTGLCDEFEKACDETGVNIIDSHADFINKAEFEQQYEKWKALDIDAVFIADSLPYAVDLVNMIREKDAVIPILSAGGFSFDDVVALAGKNSSNIAYAALYYPELELDSLREFNSKYKSLYGTEPASFLASKGYECVWLIADAIKHTGSKASGEIADYLHSMEPWQGVFNSFNFKENGDPDGIDLFIVEVKDGTYTLY